MHATEHKRLITQIVSCMTMLALALPAMAAVAPAESGPYDWSGPYLGIYGGGAKGHDSFRDRNSYNADGSFGYSVDGLLGGVDGGYNWQCKHVVIGLEGEAGRLGLDDSQQLPRFQGVRQPDDSRASIRSGFCGSLAARLGYAFDNILIYSKAGAAGLNEKVSYVDTDPSGLVLDSGTSKNAFRGGFTYGGGIEIGLNQHWTVKGEYMVANFDSVSHTATASNGHQYRFSQELKDLQMLKAGVAYKF